MNRRSIPQSCSWFGATLGLLICLGAIQALSLPQIGRYNLGWLALSRAFYSTEPDNPWPARATQLLMAATDAPARRAFLGMGLAEMLQSHPKLAFRAWSTGGIDAMHLIRLGPVYEARNMLDQALTLYRGADYLLQQPENTGVLRAGALCRRLRLEPSTLAAMGQRFCREYFAGNNWTLDGEFINTDLSAWISYGITDPILMHHRPSLNIGQPPPSLELQRIDLPLGRENGSYQIIPMQPGERFRFSAQFRIEGEEEFSARLLYVEWIDLQGRGAGNQIVTTTEPTDWIYLEREFELISETPQNVRFFPVRFSGSATIWVDNVRLELLSE